jgi:hypothetical protein
MENTSIQSYLAPGETLLWSGGPKRKFRFERKHLPILFFTLPFLAFILIPIFSVFTSDASDQGQTDSVQTQPPTTNQTGRTPPAKKPTLAGKILLVSFFLLFFGGILGFMIVGIGAQLGGNVFPQGETLYGITNQRLIIVTGKKQKLIRSVHLGTVTDIRMKEWSDGLGTISFGPDAIWPYYTQSRNSNALLENISEPGKVFQIILQARNSR